MRQSLTRDPFLDSRSGLAWRERGQWPARWIGIANTQLPFIAAFRRRFTLDTAIALRLHISADERYELFIDGERIGRGPERGAPERWSFESYTVELGAGEHSLVALVWAFGAQAAIAQMSVRPGFLCAAEEPHQMLSTDTASWEIKLLNGYSQLSPSPAHWRGARTRLDAARHPWGWERGDGEGWLPADNLEPAIAHRADWEFVAHHLLTPAELPPQLAEPRGLGIVRHIDQSGPDSEPTPVSASAIISEPAWQSLALGQGEVTVPANTARRVIFDLEDYCCAYPEICVEGGADSLIRLRWAESLRHSPSPWEHTKGNRNAVEGKYFVGFGDELLADGGRRTFMPLWWHAGRYIELCIQTADQPLTIRSLRLVETRYPLEDDGTFESDDGRLAALTPLLVRGMQMCAHETFMDCPYYEELQYAGDARLEMLTGYVMALDARLARKGIRLFDASRLPGGLTASRYPSHQLQIIAPFSLWWVAMVVDYAFWRDDPTTVQTLMPGVRATLEAFERYRTADGLIRAPEGWNFVDWAPEWSADAGAPPGATASVSGALNWQLAYVQTLAANLEEQLGEPELATRLRRRANQTAQGLDVFWDEGRGLYADDLDHTSFSEHTQSLAILSGLMPDAYRAQVAGGLIGDPNIVRTTIFYMHYLFEAFRELGRGDALLERMQLWFELPERGLRTPVEMPEPTRSDCHAWGSHPLFHYRATLLGVRPAGLGFRRVEIAPLLGSLNWARGSLPHPRGTIEVELRRDGDTLYAQIALPDGVEGTLHWQGQTVEVGAGRSTWVVSS